MNLYREAYDAGEYNAPKQYINNITFPEFFGICGQRLEGEDPYHVADSYNHPVKNPTGHWPRMASFGVLYKDSTWEHKCGATLITNSHFITAAHCLYSG